MDKVERNPTLHPKSTCNSMVLQKGVGWVSKGWLMKPQPMNGLKLGSNGVRFAFWKDTSGGIVGDRLWEHWLK